VKDMPRGFSRYNATWPWALPAGVKTAETSSIRSMRTLREQCAKLPRKCAKLRTSAPSHFSASNGGNGGTSPPTPRFSHNHLISLQKTCGVV
jgi:hypothetical protein